MEKVDTSLLLRHLV